MPLTLYAAHVLLLAAPVEPALPWVEYIVHVAVLVGFALVWSRWFARGPLEQVLWWATDTVRRAIVGRPGPAAAEQASTVRPGGR